MTYGIGLKWLAAYVDLIPPELHNAPFPFPYQLATAVLGAILGTQWLQENVFRPKRPNAYLGSQNASGYDLDLHVSRTTLLGESLYNLQLVPGVLTPEENCAFNTICKRLSHDRKGIEGTCLELEGMRLLWSNSIPFRLMHEGTLDYDVEITLPDGTTSACLEMKCQGTAMAVKPIVRKLDDARGDQIPKDRCGIILMKVPQAWIEQGSAYWATLKSSVDRFFPNSPRIVEVIFYASLFFRHPDACATSLITTEFLNPDSPYLLGVGKGILHPRTGPNTGRWLDFFQLTPQLVRELARVSG